MRLLAIRMNAKNVFVLTMILVSSIFASCAIADLRSDNFNDNSQAPTWKKFEQNPDGCWINEINQRLEVTANGDANNRPALYITRDYGFITTDDFQVKIDFYNSVLGNWNEIFMAIGFRDGLDNFDKDYILLSAACYNDYKEFWYQHVRDRQSVASNWKTRSSDSGTLYISYDASKDEVYLSDSGYGSANAWKTFSGVLQGEWAGRLVGIGIGGDSKYVAMSSGQIYLDNFVIDSGRLCTRIEGDLNEDCTVDFKDFAILAGNWLREISCNYKIVNLRQLTDGLIGESGCAFNADGTKVAYRNFHTPYSWNYCDIWTIETNGSNNTQVTAAINGEFEPAFLPDGRITYSKEFGSNDYDIWMVDANGSNPHSFIGGEYRQSNANWHPSGTSVAYSKEYQQDKGEIWIADMNGTPIAQLTNHSVDGLTQSNPVYSRSGNLIVYANYADIGEPLHIWIMDAVDGTGKQQITGGTSSQSPCFWWPDDSRIGYTENGKVYLRDMANGTDQLLLEIPGATIDECDLSIDGTKLVFALSDVSEFHIWIGDVICEP